MARGNTSARNHAPRFGRRARHRPCKTPRRTPTEGTMIVEKRKWGWLAALALCAFGWSACGNLPIGENNSEAIAGTWAWFDTPTVYIDTNGDLRLPGTAAVGRWAPLDPAARTYELAWANGYVDHLTLSL